MTKKLLPAVVLLGLMACAPAKENAKSETLTLSRVGSVNVSQTKGTSTAAVSTKTTAGTKTKKDSIIGRDSVTPFDPNKPLLPPAKRP